MNNNTVQVSTSTGLPVEYIVMDVCVTEPGGHFSGRVVSLSTLRVGGVAASAEEKPSNGHNTPQLQPMTTHTSACGKTPTYTHTHYTLTIALLTTSYQVTRNHERFIHGLQETLNLFHYLNCFLTELKELYYI